MIDLKSFEYHIQFKIPTTNSDIMYETDSKIRNLPDLVAEFD